MSVDLRLLRAFVRESNKIEGITRAPLIREMGAHERFLRLEHVAISDLEAFVKIVAPGHRLRDREGLNVRVGNHIAPEGGPEVSVRLSDILTLAGAYGGRQISPWNVHRSYETLHPFTDGNGRSGRALWLWQMLKVGADPYALQRGFLHTFYYQTLAEARA